MLTGTTGYSIYLWNTVEAAIYLASSNKHRNKIEVYPKIPSGITSSKFSLHFIIAITLMDTNGQEAMAEMLRRGGCKFCIVTLNLIMVRATNVDLRSAF